MAEDVDPCFPFQRHGDLVEFVEGALGASGSVAVENTTGPMRRAKTRRSFALLNVIERGGCLAVNVWHLSPSPMTEPEAGHASVDG